MLNADMGLVSNFDGYMDTETGEVSCAMPNSVDNTLTPCPSASTLDKAAEYSQDNVLWLHDFHRAFTKMMHNCGPFDSECIDMARV
jgi:hypothetical protein